MSRNAETLAAAANARKAAATAAHPRSPGVVSLLAGQADETFTMTGSTIAADTSLKLFGAQSHKVTVASGTTSTAKITAFTQGQVTGEYAGVGLLIFIPDATLITALTIQLYSDSTDSNYYQHNITGLRGGLAANLKGVAGTGAWNYIRWPALMRNTVGTPKHGQIDHCRVTVVTNAATTYNIQQLWVEQRPKASMLFIHDGGYSAWDKSPGYWDLRDRNFPVTWSLDCGLIGDENHITDTRARQVGAENGNSMSFHGWDGTSSHDFTATDAQAHTMKAIKWLGARGFTGRIWRSAWLQNDCPQASAAEPLVLASPMSGSSNVETLNTWPFYDRYNVVRIVLHGKNQGQIDQLFTDMKNTHGVCVIYTHRVGSTSTSDIVPEMWAYFLNKLDAAIAEGWLEGVTLESLLESSGIGLQQGMGGALSMTWPSGNGTPGSFTTPS